MDSLKIKVEIVGRERVELSVKKGVTVEEVMKMLGLNPVEYVAIKDGSVVPEEEEIREASDLKLVPVVSGG